MFLRKGVLNICSKFTGEHPCRSAISIKLQSNFIEIVLRHECSPINLLHIFRTPFPRNTSGWLLLTLSFYVIRVKNTTVKKNYFEIRSSQQSETIQSEHRKLLNVALNIYQMEAVIKKLELFVLFQH